MEQVTPTTMRMYDLGALLAQVKQEETWQQKPYHTVTVREGPMTAQVLEGRLKFSAGPDSAILLPGHLITLPAGVQHHLEALEDTAFLLTRITG